MIEKEPFVRYKEDGESRQDTFTVKMTPADRAMLEAGKRVIEQKKDSTALKQLAYIGAKVLLEEKTAYLLAVVFKNKRNNARLGVIDFEQESDKSDTKSGVLVTPLSG